MGQVGGVRASRLGVVAAWAVAAAAMGVAASCGSGPAGCDGGTCGGGGGLGTTGTGTGGGSAGGGGGGRGGGGGSTGPACAFEGFDAGPVGGGNGTGPVVYSGDRTQSPIDAALAAHLAAVAAAGHGQPRVFSKVGDSITASGSGVGGGQFLNCFDGTLEGQVSYQFNVHLGRHCSLRPTIPYFQATIPGTDGGSWSRASLSAHVGMGANWPLQLQADGGPSVLDQELAITNPRYAVVMFGSNDIGYYGGATYPVLDQVEAYETSMRALADTLLARGVIPVLTTMPPRWDHLEWMNYVPAFTGAVRGIAQGRQVPLIDYNRELMAIGPPAYGLGGDGVHPTGEGYNTFCWLDDASLASYGYNVRNYVTLVALDRLRQVVGTGGPPPDPDARRLAGCGLARLALPHPPRCPSPSCGTSRPRRSGPPPPRPARGPRSSPGPATSTASSWARPRPCGCCCSTGASGRCG